MGIHVCQSQCLDVLLQALFKQMGQSESSVFNVLATQHFIVPNKAVEQWLMQSIAEQKGISANQIFHQRIQSFQWYAYQQVLTDKDQVRQANIPRLVMKWRIYEAIRPFITPIKQQIGTKHPLYELVKRIYDSAIHLTQPLDIQLKKQGMLYWIAEQVSRLFSHYMQYRGQNFYGQAQDWLTAWGNDQALDIERYIANPSQSLSLYDLEQAKSLEVWQRWLWQHIFHTDFQKIKQIDRDFWASLDHDPQVIRHLPQQLMVFTLLELAPSQLQFLRQLGQYIDVVIYHYNPSQEYWADSVDPNWKKQYDIGVKERFIEKNKQRGHVVNDEEIQQFFEAFNYQFNAEARESRHPLLTRFGKQARDHFSLLANLSSGEEGEWFDLFIDQFPDTVLGKVQSDILYLMEPEKNSYVLTQNDASVQVHVCHSSLRQLEVLKDQLLHWLSQGTKDQPRRLDDILVLTPDLKALEPIIRSVFTPPPRQNGQHQESYIPVKISGVAPLDVGNAWRSVVGRIQLPQGRFSFEEFTDWLSLLTTQKFYGLDALSVERIIVLLSDAGFKRGLDEQHLQRFLADDDHDFRYTFKFALDRLALGIAVPEHQLFENTLSYDRVSPTDFTLIAILIEIYNDLNHRRDWLICHEQGQAKSVEFWIKTLQQEIMLYRQKGEDALKPVADIIQKHIRMLTLSIYHDQHNPQDATVPLDALTLPLAYIVSEIQQGIDTQLENAEPSGQVTFSQIGSIRPIPYRLVVMLNLDSSTFPSRHSHVPFDLMKVLRPYLGDRSRLEDDQGAFLDALLLAKESLWMFYNGFDVSDGEVRQPSSVLHELMEHLAFLVKTDSEIDDYVDLDGIEVKKQIQALYHVHTLQPFDVRSFNQNIRYQDQWFTVAKQIQQTHTPRQPWQTGEYEQEAQLQVLHAQHWMNDVVFPAQLYLKTIGVKNIHPEQFVDENEPLVLDGLGRYAVRDFMQQCESPNQALLMHHLPVGKVQQSAWQHTQSEFDVLKERLIRYAPCSTPTTQQTLQISEQLYLQFELPEGNEQDWVSLNTASARGERRTKVWLEYLLWVQSLNLNQEGQSYRRIVVFSDQTIICTGLSSEQAEDYLKGWWALWEKGQKTPVVLPAALLLKTNKTAYTAWAQDKKTHEWTFNLDATVKAWENTYTANTDFLLQDDRSSYLHRDWQFLLQQQDATALLKHACEAFAELLYAPICQYQTVETEE